MGPSAIAKELKIPRQTLSNFLQRYQTRDKLENNYKINKPRSLNERDERRQVRLCIANRRATSKMLQQMLDIDCTAKTIRNALKRHGFRARRPQKKPALDDKQKKKRFLLAQEHNTWIVEIWRSDEKKLNLHHPDGNEKV